MTELHNNLYVVSPGAPLGLVGCLCEGQNPHLAGNVTGED